MLVRVGSQKDERNRICPIYCDTDDLCQEDFFIFCKLQEERKYEEALKFLKNKI